MEMNESFNSEESLPMALKSKKHHKHPCICDAQFRKKRRQPLDRFEAMQKSLEYLRPCTEEELCRRGALKGALRSTKQTMEELQKEEEEEEEEIEETAEEKAERENEERQRRKELREKRRLENMCLQTKDIEGTDFEMRWMKDSDRLYLNRRGNIKWNKVPDLPIRLNRTQTLRKEHTVYCKKKFVYKAHTPAGEPGRTLPPPPKH